MGKLIKAEFYKLQKLQSFRIIFLFTLAIGILRGFSPCPGYQVYTLGLFPGLSDAVLVSVFTSAFICTEFSNRTFGNAFLCGTPRQNVFLAKLAVYFPGLLILILVPLAASTSVATMRNGLGTGLEAVALEITINSLFYILHRFSMASFTIFTASAIQNPIATPGFSIAGIYLMELARNPVENPAAQYAFIVSIIKNAIFLSAAAFIFIKRDLK